MKLTRIPTYPTAAALRKAPVGTIYVYRRDFPFAIKPTWLVVLKLADDRWVRSQSTVSRDDAIAAISNLPVASPHTLVVDDVDSARMAQLVTRKEVEADGKERHVGLFVGMVPASKRPVREEPSRPDPAPIAAARKAAGTKAGKAALATLLKRHRKQRGATAKQLAALAAVIGKVPPDLAQLLQWSNGHAGLELMSIPQLIDVFEGRDDPRLLPLNDNENGDYWGLVLAGPLQGALFWDDYSLDDDPPADAIKAISLAAWLADPDAYPGE